MIYAPHTLYLFRRQDPRRDEFGKCSETMSLRAGEKQYVCPCRCDDNTTREFRSADGTVYRPLYHIVCDLSDEVSRGVFERIDPGTEVECEFRRLDAPGHGRNPIIGRVYMVKRTNYFNYGEIWI